MSAPAPEWVWLARIRRPQGRKGEVFADILTDFPEKFAERRRLWLLAPDAPSVPAPSSQAGAPSIEARSASTGESSQPRPVELLHHWLHKGGVVLHFAGVDSISAAETLAGLIVALPRAERAALSEDEVYIGDLIGCELVDVTPAPAVPVGRIQNVDRSAGPVALLLVQGPRGEVLVPFAKSYLRKLDLENRRIEMSLPEGLTDL